MTYLSKKHCIRVLESFGWKYLGFNDLGWGEKFYCFNIPNRDEQNPAVFKLGQMRRKAYHMDFNR